MKYALSLGLLLGAVAVAFAQQPAAPPRSPQAAPPPSPPPAVKVGDAMPDFTLPYLEVNAEGRPQPKQVKLSDFKGKQAVVLAFFPAAFSPGWTTEMQRYRENAAGFNAANAAVFGVSVDSTWANKAFREQVGVDFPILSDWKKEYTRKLGILNEESGTARRTTFVIDAEGILQHFDQDREALDPSGAVGACSLLKKKTAGQ